MLVLKEPLYNYIEGGKLKMAKVTKDKKKPRDDRPTVWKDYERVLKRILGEKKAGY